MILFNDSFNGHYCLYHWTSPAPEWSKKLFNAELRAKQHASSRTALHEILKSLMISSDPKTISIFNHQHIKGMPKFTTSLSHTKDGWAVGLITSDTNYLGVGVDLEFKDRIFKKETQKLFVNTEDEYEDLLDLWCKKEAAFKAISPLLTKEILDKVFVLKDIFIKNDHFGLIKSGKVLGFINSVNKTLNEKELMITSAFIDQNF